LGIKDLRDGAAWDRALIAPDARVRELSGDQITQLGDDQPEAVEMELVRRAERSLPATPDAFGPTPNVSTLSRWSASRARWRSRHD